MEEAEGEMMRETWEDTETQGGKKDIIGYQTQERHRELEDVVRGRQRHRRNRKKEKRGRVGQNCQVLLSLCRRLRDARYGGDRKIGKEEETVRETQM
jgi:hypothetical protein